MQHAVRTLANVCNEKEYACVSLNGDSQSETETLRSKYEQHYGIVYIIVRLNARRFCRRGFVHQIIFKPFGLLACCRGVGAPI